MAGTAGPTRVALAQPSVDTINEVADARARTLFISLVSAYAVAFAALIWLDLLAPLWRVAVTPALFVVAYLAGRFRAFVRDWALYGGAIALCDSCRGLVYGLTRHFELPVHMGYVIRAEHALFGTTIPALALQQRLGDGIDWFTKVLVVVHASHFAMFLGFGLLLWWWRAESFPRFRLAILLTMYGGVLGYLLVPTVPPWMAANHYRVLPPLAQLARQVYNVWIPGMAATLDINPIAAMPSLHTAFPALLTLVCLHHFGARGLLMAAYLVTAVFGVIYMGEHYVVDTFAGFALAMSAYLCAYHTKLAARWVAGSEARIAAGPRAPLQLGRILGTGALLLALAQVAESTAARLRHDVPSEAFIARELDVRSPMASYFRGLRAYRAGEYADAQRYFDRARHEMPTLAQEQLQAGRLLGESAYYNRDWAMVARTLGRSPELTPDQRVMLAETSFALGLREQGLQLIDQLGTEVPRDPLLRTKSVELLRDRR